MAAASSARGEPRRATGASSAAGESGGEQRGRGERRPGQASGWGELQWRRRPGRAVVEAAAGASSAAGLAAAARNAAAEASGASGGDGGERRAAQRPGTGIPAGLRHPTGTGTGKTSPRGRGEQRWRPRPGRAAGEAAAGASSAAGLVAAASNAAAEASGTSGGDGGERRAAQLPGTGIPAGLRHPTGTGTGKTSPRGRGEQRWRPRPGRAAGEAAAGASSAAGLVAAASNAAAEASGTSGGDGGERRAAQRPGTGTGKTSPRGRGKQRWRPRPGRAAGEAAAEASSAAGLAAAASNTAAEASGMSPPPPPQQPNDPSLPALPDDLIAEILIRLSPDEPACLFHASLVCKRWRRLLSDHAFLRHYRAFHRAFHRAPPLLGLLHNAPYRSRISFHHDPYFDGARFVPTTAFCPADPDLPRCHVFDCRHGRVLLEDYCSSSASLLLLWDPMTGEKQHVREPDIPRRFHNAAVLCATAGCDHLDCHGGPFFVAFVGTNCADDDDGVHACLYSSTTDAWSAPSYLQLHSYVEPLPPVLVGDALYFVFESGIKIVCYDLGGDGGLTMTIDPPKVYMDGVALMPVEDGGLGFAGLNMLTLHLWSLETGPGEVAGWTRRGVIELEMLPLGNTIYPLALLGFAMGCDSDLIFVCTGAGVFMIELSSRRATMVFESDRFYAIFPYMSFCTPGLASGRLPAPSTAQ